MCYLKFDKIQMTNLQESLPKEILCTNRSGAYSCTTILGCNTRKYHGLLVVPIPELDTENHVLLSSLDETIIQHGAEFNLALHKYQGENFSPKGHKYIRGFEWEKVPTTIYRVGGVVIQKEFLFERFESRIIIRYTLLEAHSQTTLRLRPFLAFRSVREYTHENNYISKHYDAVENGIKTSLYPNYPELYMQMNKKSDFVYQPDWYRGLDYPKERERGYASNEDLYVPGYFEMTIKKGESIVFSAGLNEIKTSQLKKIMDKEIEALDPQDSFYHCLVSSAHQFHIQRGEENYLIAGYPWFKCRARDLFISMPGLTLSLGETEQFESYMITATKAIEDFIEGATPRVRISEIEQPDTFLWAIWCIQQYGKSISREQCNKKYGALLEKMMEYLLLSKHKNLFVHENGLLYSSGKKKAVTWMNSSVNGKPIVPRSGYIVEFNALWYNALKFYAQMLLDRGEDTKATELEKLAEKVANSFHDIFLNEYGYLLDYVDGNMMDWSVRPNMIFAVALDYSPLTLVEKKHVLDICTKELVTPKGIRSLSPKSGGYNPLYCGPQSQRDYAYHQGTAWPWLTGFYLEAYLRVYKMSGISYIERQLIGFEEELFNHCLCSISELFEGNPPFHGRGATSFAMNVAGILRSIRLFEKNNTL
ncbi:MAG: glycogen debranching enzyme N-terminal domain-containing protein [Bacteroidaceae bacterium]